MSRVSFRTVAGQEREVEVPDRPFRTVDGSGSGPKPWRRGALDESEQITCDACRADIGVSTSAVTHVTLAPVRRPSGKLAGGRKILACAFCLSRGKITELGRA
jgi:hypothetical protein